MADSTKNIILHGASGKIGDLLVIRQRAGRTILSAAPGKREKEATENQKEHQSRFQQAIIYGKSVVDDETKKAEYAEKATGMKTAFNVAVADFFHAPDIEEIDLTNYNGAVNDIIRIRATDDFKVERVHVAIYNSDGSLVEEGDATKTDNQLDWLYTSTVVNESLDGDKIIVQAIDRPGNVTEEERNIS